ncbi:protein kinase C-binding protein 1 isoform X2 [Anthonomus grandis grandis]|uniref:protein kinase C-binding protein 1 isoform X2 n=1 Tax=Anthonomus grandis grandis TaxID=2921223 RepID=UPI0021666214|nr:protein kinase C-binding protein 1 isoform X2 [Anthonomus grandis grandis]
MSTEGIDQPNGDASKDDEGSSPVSILTDQSLTASTSQSTISDSNNVLNDTDNSVDQKVVSEPQPHPVPTADNQEGEEIVNKQQTSESDVKPDPEETSNQSRELKSLLALSKEARLETNLSRKRKSSSLRKKSGKRIQYPVTAESELEVELQNSEEGSKMEPQDEEGESRKRTRNSLSEVSLVESTNEDTPKKNRKSFTYERNHDVVIFKPNKDMFCWRCHKDNVNIACETCPRSYHQKCLKQTIKDPEHWPCPECVSILKAESTQTRSPALRGMTLEHLCSLLKFAVYRMIQCQGSEPFVNPVNEADFPEYKKYIIQPMDLTLLEKNIKENLYGSTQAFEADAKWILHNSIVFNSTQSKLSSIAKSIIKICKQEMSEIENCPTCYLNANTKKKTWFVEVCPKPHLLVWAKLRGFPFWPGKAMSCKDGTVDVRFFGAHDRAWVPEKECFLYSPKDPNLFRVKRSDIEQCVEELEIHVKNLKKAFGEFHYPTFKTPLDPDNELKQIQIFLPRYKANLNKSKPVRRSLEKEKDPQKEDNNQEVRYVGKKTRKSIERPGNDEDNMEGYGTDDESTPQINTELRKHLLEPQESHNDMEAEEDDTQVPASIEPNANDEEEIVLSKEQSDDLEPPNLTPESPTNRLCPETSCSLSPNRQNSDPKEPTTKLSDKINRVDVLEDLEISLDKGTVCVENISSSNSECSSDFGAEIKKKPVQVDVDNVEFTISPASKLKLADKLIKRLSDVDGKVEEVKRDLSEEVSDSKEEETVSSPNKKEENDAKNQEGPIEGEPSDKLVKDGRKKVVIKAIVVSRKSREKNDEDASTSKSPIKEQEPLKDAASPVTEDKCVDLKDDSAENEKNEEKAVEKEKGSKETEVLEKDTNKTQEEGGAESTEASDTIVNFSDSQNNIEIVIQPNETSEKPPELPAKPPTPTEKRNKTKRKRSIEFDVSVLENQNKVLKLVEALSEKSDKESIEISSGVSILKSSLQARAAINSLRTSIDIQPDDIKSEPDSSGTEEPQVQELEAKKKYLSALNILEKGEIDIQKSAKSNEIRTRSKTEEKRERFRVSNEPEVVDNMTRVIDDVAVNFSADLVAKKKPAPSNANRGEGGEIYVKSFAKFVPDSPQDKTKVAMPTIKHRARKSFPHPTYKPVQKPVTSIAISLAVQPSNESILRLTPRMSIATTTTTSPATTVVMSPLASAAQPPRATITPLQQMETMRPTANGFLILPPSQQEGVVFLPPNQTINYGSPGSQMVSMASLLTGAAARGGKIAQPQVWLTGQTSEKRTNFESQNYIPQGENSNATSTTISNAVKALANDVHKIINGGVDSSPAVTVSEGLPATPSVTITTSNTVPEHSSTVDPSPSVELVEPAMMAETRDDNEFAVLNSVAHENISRAVSEIIRRPPPKLKPRPPGPLSQQFNEGTPSTAGPVTARVNSIAHRLGDYFRGMLIETLEDLGKSNNHEATIANLKLEIESLKHQHSIEISEIEKNTCTVLKDLQKSIVEDRERVIDETRAACEAETVRRVEEAKSKQWCAICPKEAQFYCCWNTSYCDYPCQQKHWPTHMNKCTQNGNQANQVGPSSTLRPAGGQQLILRPTNPPQKAGLGRVFTKPVQKVYMNRSVAASPKTMRVQTSAGSLLTMMETTPGNYQLITTSPIVRTNTTVRPSLVSIASPTINTYSKTTTSSTKQPPVRVISHTIPVTTMLEEESD